MFDFNTAAQQWYQRLGFQTGESTSWWQATLADAPPAPVRLIGYAQAQACQREYGFSQFGIVAAGQHYDVGRLGAKWYRATNPAAITAPGVLAILRRLSPERRLLLLTKTELQAGLLPEAVLLAVSHRLTAPLALLRERLS